MRPIAIDEPWRPAVRPHVWLAARHGMLVINMSTARGQTMGDLITGRAPALDPHPSYRAERFA
ncbi:FAD-dependent oxidoreductase [Xanthomonas populi]|uniref:FAD-dependent oxidoreductase n=1 Tax=Xanthomonas populi TaxID=53414 RepID=A0A2S7ELL6_9XANT|nr:FAD-dependent oxidoreductase [Xanthomonas populi]